MIDPGALLGDLLGYLILLAVQVYFLLTRSQSLGKMALKIVIWKADGSGRAPFFDLFFKRELFVFLLGKIPVLGLIFSLVNPLFIYRKDRRCVHDLMAGTKVIKSFRT